MTRVRKRPSPPKTAAPSRPRYQQPAGDDHPLDFIEALIVKAIAPSIVAEIKAELAAEHKASQASSPDTLFNPSKLVKRLGNEVSVSTLAKWRVTGQGPRFIKIGRSVVYREGDIQQWLAEQTRNHTNDHPASGRRRTKGAVR